MVITVGERVLVASHGWRPGVLPNILHSPHHKKPSAQNVNSAEGERARESWLRGSVLLNTGLPKGI